MIDWYDWAGGREAIHRFGPRTGPVVVAALPLFEEANRTRTLMVRVLRLLAERGIAGVLPDLPGQGESLVPTQAATLANMREAFAAVPGDVSVSIRSGALIACGERRGHWMLAPQTAFELNRELHRLKFLTPDQQDYAGNSISPTLIGELAEAPIAEGRIVRLDSDARPADARLPGDPVWRRSEPADDPALAAAMAQDIADWVQACAA